MQSTFKVNILNTWGRFSLWVNQHQAMARLVSLTTGLVVFLVIVPSYMRAVFWNGLQSHHTLAMMLLVFSLLAVSLVWSTGQRIDAWVFLVFNLRGGRPIWLDRLMSGYTQIGNGAVSLGFSLVWYFSSDHLLAYELILGTLTLWLVVEVVKFLAHRSRPFILLTQARIVGYRARGRSFPSGHTSQAFFIATLIAQHYNASLLVVVLLYSAALLVGITRMYVGAHYPRDVLAGAILGSAWGLLGVIVDGYVLNGIR